MSRTTVDCGQDELFRTGEGDRYFWRNRERLGAEAARATDPPLAFIRGHRLRPRRAVELGCANGWRLAWLRNEFGCRAVGVDASLEAVSEGARSFPGVELHHGTLADPPDIGCGFDLAIVHFVFHWNARETLFLAVAHVDRLLADGGWLIVGDFLPDRPCRRIYHHAPREGIHTYKQDYARLFTASNLYRQIDRVTFDAEGRGGGAGEVAAASRGVCSLLVKSWTDGYPIDGA